MLEEHEQDLLRAIALDAIRAGLLRVPTELDLPRDGPLVSPGSAFVTLKKRGRLRGCIGLIGNRMPLGECVRHAAGRALEDSRFNPVQRDELPDLDLEISVLTEFVTITDVADIEVGRHGLMVSALGRSGLLLPQVAVEHQWNRDTFLRQACMKAGLPPEDWQRSDLEIEVFSAEVF